MARYTDTLRDQYQRPISGALVSVIVSGTNAPAVLTDDGGQPLDNPFLTDDYGSVVFNTSDALYDLSYRYGGRLVLTEERIVVGTPASLPVGAVIDSLGIGTTVAPSQAAVKGGLDAKVSLTTLAASAGSSQVGFLQAGTGAAARTMEVKGREVVSVTDFVGADPTGVTDSTAAFNLATEASAAHTGNDTLLKRLIKVPAGTYKINGTIYLRKGQQIVGDGMGATYLDLSTPTDNTKASIKFGQSSGGAVDPGGLACEVAGLFTFGGPTSAGVLDTTNCAGWAIHDCFMTSSGISIVAGGGDGLVNNCILDQGLTGVVLSGQNIAIRNTLFYAFNYHVRVQSNTYDCEVDNCHFEYAQYASISAESGSTNILNFSVSDCKFVQNVQYATHLAAILVAGTGADFRISDCAFRNIKGYAISYNGGFSHTLIVSNCLFEGLKSNPAYAQSTTMGGIDLTNMSVTATGCTFRNLPGSPVNLGGTEGSTLDISDSRFISNTGGTYDIAISNSNAFSTAYINNCRSSRSLVQPQAIVPVYAPRVVTGQATLVAGTVTVAQTLTRASSKITVWRQTDGGTVGASYSVVRTAGTGFAITAKDGVGVTQAADTSVVNWSLELAGT